MEKTAKKFKFGMEVDENENINAAKTARIEWTDSVDGILSEIGDVAQIYRLLCSESHIRYQNIHNGISLPIFILSSFVGLATFAKASMPTHTNVYADIFLGCISFFISILSGVLSIFSIPEKKKVFQTATKQWGKLATHIKIELAKEPTIRMDANSFFNITKREYERLLEITEVIPKSVLIHFQKTFRGQKGTVKRKLYDSLAKPDILGAIISIHLSRHKWNVTGEDDGEQGIPLDHRDLSSFLTPTPTPSSPASSSIEQDDESAKFTPFLLGRNSNLYSKLTRVYENKKKTPAATAPKDIESGEDLPSLYPSAPNSSFYSKTTDPLECKSDDGPI